MRIDLLIAFAVLIATIFGPQPASREGLPVKPAPDSGSRVYSDQVHSIYLKGGAIEVRNAATGETNRVNLPPPYFRPSPEDPEIRPARAEKEGDTLRLRTGRTVYDVRLSPRPAVAAVYPDPGCSGDKIIVDKHKNLLHLYKKGRLVKICNVSTGVRPEYTPEGEFTVINKQALPPGFGEGRFGPRWLGIGVPSEKDLRSEKPDPRAPAGIKYGLHGTNEPGNLGAYASGGCIRLNNKDIMEIYNMVEIGTPIEIIR